jgi:hypothetical protein
MRRSRPSITKRTSIRSRHLHTSVLPRPHEQAAPPRAALERPRQTQRKFPCMAVMRFAVRNARAGSTRLRHTGCKLPAFLGRQVVHAELVDSASRSPHCERVSDTRPPARPMRRLPTSSPPSARELSRQAIETVMTFRSSNVPDAPAPRRAALCFSARGLPNPSARSAATR